MRLLAVVVLYHPGKDLAGNIDSYLSQVDKLLLWDNTPGDGQERLPLPDISHPERLEYRGCGRNVGIGAALNDAVAYAREYGYTHLLTLDQDSFFLQGDFRRYITAIQEYGENKRIIFSVNYFIKSRQSSLYPVTDTVDEVSSAMTSGTVYPVGLFEELGVFMEELFVWGIVCGALIVSIAGVRHAEACGRFVSKVSCCSTIWDIRRRNTAYWVRRFSRTNILRHVLIIMCVMVWCFTNSILKV